MSNLIGVLASILGITSAIASISTSTMSPFILFISFIYVSIIYIRFLLRKQSIYLNYRFSDKPQSLDLKINEIRTESDVINLFLSDNTKCSHLGKIFSCLRWKLLIVIEYPEGIKIAKERLSSEFDTWQEASGYLMLGKNITASGRRVIRLYVGVEPESGFEGDSPISVKVYIAPKMRGFRQLSSLVFGTLGDSNINILPS